jgi:hypothetical protein
MNTDLRVKLWSDVPVFKLYVAAPRAMPLN